MKLNVHEVKSVKLEEKQSFGSFVTRTLTILDEKGNSYEITLFASESDFLNIEI